MLVLAVTQAIDLPYVAVGGTIRSVTVVLLQLLYVTERYVFCARRVLHLAIQAFLFRGGGLMARVISLTALKGGSRGDAGRSDGTEYALNLVAVIPLWLTGTMYTLCPSM